MSSPYVGEIRIFAGTFAPLGWEFCEGQIVPISENDTLFNLIGTTYGGDGQQTFALPDLRGRLPLHQGTYAGTAFTQGEAGGAEEVTLTTAQIPPHNHAFTATNAAGTTSTPTNNAVASSTSVNLYNTNAPGASFGSAAVGPAGGSQPHSNMQPFLCVNFIISLFGVYPSPT